MVVHYGSCLLISKVFSITGTPMILPIHTSIPVIAAFTLVDQAICVFVYLGYGKQLPHKRLLSHVTFGFLNTKTYYILCLLLCQDSPIDLVQLLCAGILSFLFIQYGALAALQRIFQIPAFPLIFYQQHRIGHLPGVYQCAHKMHHFLFDSTPFDAMVYGEGMGEQYCWLVVEACMSACFGLPPYILNPTTLHASLTNKFGHSRYDLEGWDMHADHHTVHNKNFGSEYQIPFEVYMQSMFVKDSVNPQCRWFNHTITQSPVKEGDSTITIELEPCANVIPSVKMTRFDTFEYIPVLSSKH